MTTDNPDTQLVAVRTGTCPSGGDPHVIAVKTADGSHLLARSVFDLMDAGRLFFMKPPPGAPSYEISAITGLPLLVQTRPCPACGERVLFA